MRIERITSRDGSWPLLNPSMRTRAAPPAISTSWRISSFGSSDSASISSSVSSVASVLFGSAAAACGSCPDFNGVGERRQLELDLLLVVAGAQAHVAQLEGVEARELGLDVVAARLQSGNRRDAGIVGGDRDARGA